MIKIHINIENLAYKILQEYLRLNKIAIITIAANNEIGPQTLNSIIAPKILLPSTFNLCPI